MINYVQILQEVTKKWLTLFIRISNGTYTLLLLQYLTQFFKINKRKNGNKDKKKEKK